MNKLTKLLSQNNFSESDVCHLLTLIRKQLESLTEEKKKSYLDLKLFCDWALHKKIDRSFAGSKLGVETQKTLLKYSKSNSDHLIQEISKTLLIPFKSQFRNFLHSQSFNTNIIDNNQIWGIFLTNLLECIEKTPISISNKAHQKEIKNSSLKLGMWIDKISVIKSNLGYLEGSIYCLYIETSDSTKIVIPITDFKISNNKYIGNIKHLFPNQALPLSPIF